MTTVSSGSASASVADWPCGSAEEHDVVAGEHLEGGRLEHPVGQRHEVRLEGAERLPRVRAGRDRADLHVGMGQQQAEHLAAGVPTRPRDRDRPFRHVHDYTVA